MNSPWGTIDASEKVIPGVRMVETPGHGGFMVTKKKGDAILSEEARSISQVYSYWPTHYCFEEDCAWAVLMWESKDIREEYCRRQRFWCDKPQNDEAFTNYLRSTLRSYYPEYLTRNPQPR
jgi:hypothetical protein